MASSPSQFDVATYQRRRLQLQQVFDSELILLLGNEESSINFRDNWYRFRQDSTFLYYIGVDRPGLAAVLDTATGETTLFGDDLTMDAIIWTGPQPTVAALAEAVGIRHSAPIATLADQLRAAQQRGQKILFLPPYRPENIQKLRHLLNIPEAQVTARASVPLINAVVAQRSIKEPEEVAELERAVNTSNRMHRVAMQTVQPGMKEYELVGKVRGEAIAGGGDIGYPIILTKDGQTLHNHYYGNTLSEGDMVLLDAGAETARHYTGDLTRTFPVGQRFTDQQRVMYQIVLNAYRAAVAALRPGVRFLDIHLLACEKLVDGLKEEGLMQGDTSDAVAAGAHALFFQCGLGHMMGLDVHDMEDLGEEYVGYSDTLKKSSQFGLKSLRLGRALESGFVLTVEPGLYFIPELINRWSGEKKFTDFIRYDQVAAFRDFGGIRVEDNFLITDEGYRKLGDSLPLTISEVEALRAER